MSKKQVPGLLTQKYLLQLLHTLECIKSAPKFLYKFDLVPQKSISEAFAPIVCHGRKKQVQRLGTYEHMLQLIYTPQRSLKDEVSDKGATFVI